MRRPRIRVSRAWVSVERNAVRGQLPAGRRRRARESGAEPRPGGANTGRPPAPPAASPAAKLAEARLHFQQGVALYQEHNYDAALAEFQGAYAASSEPVVLYNMGLTFKALFRYADAVATLEHYLSESAARKEALTPERRSEVEGIVAEMKSLLAEVTIVVRPPPATVRVDGRPVALGIEGIVKLAAGTHSIEALLPDYAPDRHDITVVAGVPQSVSLALTPIPHTGRVRINASQTGAHVAVDGREESERPRSRSSWAPGGTIWTSPPRASRPTGASWRWPRASPAT